MVVVLKDIMPHGVRLVFIGEAAGDESARRGHYYAKAGNSFWDDLFEAGLMCKRLTPEQDGCLPSYGIGLTDLVKDLTNSELKREAYVPAAWERRVADLKRRIQAAEPEVVCFNGLGVASDAVGGSPSPGRLGVSFAGAEAWAVDSSSGAARRWHPRRLDTLRKLADRISHPCSGA